MPSWQILRWAYDKRMTYRLASFLRIDHPWTLYPKDREEALSAPCEFPVILKPAYHKTKNEFTSAKAWRVRSREDLISRYDEACKLVGPSAIMLQSVIPGGGDCQFSYAALCDKGRTLAAVTARRTRQYPLDFGHSSTYVETTSEPCVEEMAQRLLAATKYSGIAEIEFKRNPSDGRYNLLDFNARFWTWHSLCGRAGVDFPYLLWKLKQGEEFSYLHARNGECWIRFATDILAAACGIRRGTLSLEEYARSLAHARVAAMLATDDPLPALIDVLILIWKGIRRCTAAASRA
jgi:predicted ATP-grasp superfamily ATP-dependent carboligase